MPLFIGISGRLINNQIFHNHSLLDVLKKYLYRLIIPWFIATLTYFIYQTQADELAFNVKNLIQSIIFPNYHLWFIPAFLSWVFATWILKKIGLSYPQILLLALFISIVAVIILKFSSLLPSLKIPVLLTGVVRTTGFHYYFFFILGKYIHELKTYHLKNLAVFTAIAGMATSIYLFFSPNPVLELLNLFAFNTALLYVVLFISQQEMISNNKFLQWLGVHSLGIYLWHVLPIQFVNHFLIDESTLEFYLVQITLQIILFITYYYLVKIHVFKTYVFGIRS